MKTYTSLRTVNKAVKAAGYMGPALTTLPAPGMTVRFLDSDGDVVCFVMGMVSRCLRTGKPLWTVFKP